MLKFAKRCNQGVLPWHSNQRVRATRFKLGGKSCPLGVTRRTEVAKQFHYDLFGSFRTSLRWVLQWFYDSVRLLTTLSDCYRNVKSPQYLEYEHEVNRRCDILQKKNSLLRQIIISPRRSTRCSGFDVDVLIISSSKKESDR
jgi:hypothetical protein